MTLPEPPLPTLSQLARALASSQPSDSTAAEFWYGTASEALAAAIQALVRSEGHSSATVWFPAYFCNDALRFVRRLSIDLRFYDVQPDLGIDWGRLDQLTRPAARSSILVLVHYFGFPNQAETAAASSTNPIDLCVQKAAAVSAWFGNPK